jgi:hypothetical protein
VIGARLLPCSVIRCTEQALLPWVNATSIRVDTRTALRPLGGDSLARPQIPQGGRFQVAGRSPG